MPTFTNASVGVSANASSQGQGVDFDAPVVTGCTLTNNSGISVQYSEDGSAWVTVASGATASPNVFDGARFRIRKTTSDSTTVAVAMTWTASPGNAQVASATSAQVASLKAAGKPLAPGTNVIDTATGDYIGTIDGDGDLSAAPGGGSVQNSLTPGSTTAAPSVDAVVGGLAGKADYFATPAVLTATAITFSAASHANRVLECSNASAQVFTFNTGGGFAAGDSGRIFQNGAGPVSIVSGTATVQRALGVIEAKTNGVRSYIDWETNLAGEIVVTFVGASDVAVAVASSRALTDADHGRVLECTATVTVTVPAGLRAGFACAIMASGTTSIDSSGGALINGATSTLTRAAASNAMFAIQSRVSAANSYLVTGA